MQGALLQANLGQSDAALSSYLKASALRERLIRDDVAADHRILRDSARGEIRLSQALLRVARLKEASAHSQLAVDLLSRVSPPAGEQDLVVRERAEAVTGHGYMLAVNGDLDAGIVLLRRAKAMYESLPVARLSENVFGAGYALTVFRLVQVLDEVPGRGQAEAIALLPKAIEMDRRLIAADPKSAGVRRGLVRDVAKLADMLSKANRCDEAPVHFDETLRLLKEDVARDPRDQLARRNYNAVAGQSTRCLIALDRADEARDRLEPALADITTLLADDPKNITLQISFCEIAVRYAEAAARIDLRRRDPALLQRARPPLARALEMLGPLVAGKTLTGGDAVVLDEARAAMKELSRDGLGTRD